MEDLSRFDSLYQRYRSDMCHSRLLPLNHINTEGTLYTFEYHVILKTHSYIRHSFFGYILFGYILVNKLLPIMTKNLY